jgi:hypothetical protein
MIRAAVSAALITAAPAGAQQPSGPPASQDWAENEAAPRHLQSGIRVPRAVGFAKLISLHAGPRPGSDSWAVYQSPDEKLFATVYVYAPPLADAALTAVATSALITQRFGPRTTIAESKRVPGQAGDYFRMRFADAVFNGSPAESYFAVGASGMWVVKLRVTGLDSRTAEAAPALEQLLRDVRSPAAIRLAAPEALPPGCAAEQPGADAPRLPVTMNDAMLAGILQTPRDEVGALKQELRLPLPRHRPGDWCIERGTMLMGGRIPGIILRGAPAREAPERYTIGRILLVGDAGTAIESWTLPETAKVRVDGKQAYYVGVSGTALGAETVAAYADWPSAAQLVATAEDALSGRAQGFVRTSLQPDGKPSVSIKSAQLPKFE